MDFKTLLTLLVCLCLLATLLSDLTQLDCVFCSHKPKNCRKMMCSIQMSQCCFLNKGSSAARLDVVNVCMCCYLWRKRHQRDSELYYLTRDRRLLISISTLITALQNIITYWTPAFWESHTHTDTELTLCVPWISGEMKHMKIEFWVYIYISFKLPW